MIHYKAIAALLDTLAVDNLISDHTLHANTHYATALVPFHTDTAFLH